MPWGDRESAPVLPPACRSVIALAFGVGLTQAAGVEIAPPVLPPPCRPRGILGGGMSGACAPRHAGYFMKSEASCLCPGKILDR